MSLKTVTKDASQQPVLDPDPARVTRTPTATKQESDSSPEPPHHVCERTYVHLSVFVCGL